MARLQQLPQKQSFSKFDWHVDKLSLPSPPRVFRARHSPLLSVSLNLGGMHTFFHGNFPRCRCEAPQKTPKTV